MNGDGDATPEEGAEPDQAAAPGGKTVPDRGVTPDQGVVSGGNAVPDRGAAPDGGGSPGQGVAPDQVAMPGGNAVRDRGADRAAATVAYLLRRIGLRVVSGAGLLALLSVLVYVGVDLLPGDPVTSRLGPTTPPARIAEIRHALGLDRPLLVRYADWAGGLLHGDLGVSATGKPVAAMLSDRFANSATLAGSALLVAAPLALLLGVLAAYRHGRGTDRTVSAAALVVLSVPEFAVAGLLVLVFAVGLGVLPAVSVLDEGVFPWSRPAVMVLPVTSLLLAGLSYAVRVIRASAIGALAAEHVEAMRLSGLPERTVLRCGVLPAVLPVAVQVWLVTGVASVGGAVLVEKVFGYPGIGEVVVTAVQTGDLPVVQATVLVLGAAMLAALLLADLAVILGTPRLRTGTAS